MSAFLPGARSASRAVAWSGVLIFVVSLACGAHFYASVPVGGHTGPPGRRAAALAANVALFAVFAIHHSLLARPTAKRWLTRLVPQALERTVYVWTASLLFLAVCLAWQRVGGEAWHLTGVAAWAARATQAAGAVAVLLSARVADLRDLAGIRQVEEAGRGGAVAVAGEGPASPLPLTTGGPYRVVRHPLYLGLIAMLCASPRMPNDRLVLSLLASIYMMLAIPWEERSLVHEYGDAYREYQRRVRWRIFPGLY